MKRAPRIVAAEIEGVADEDRAVEIAICVEKAGRRIEELYGQAKDPESPMHSWIFNCSDTEAADKHFLNRTRLLVRTIKVKWSDEDPVAPPERMFVHVSVSETDDEEEEDVQQRYVLLRDARANAREMSDVLSYRVGQVCAHIRYVESLGDPALAAEFAKRVKGEALALTRRTAQVSAA